MITGQRDNEQRDNGMTNYQVVIGLEVHLQLKTESKIFCGCSAEYNLEPNIQGCPVCAGLPGVLPVLNEKAKRFTLMAALALNCKINPFSSFSRKQYFYPDLPKNYQISQYDLPVAENGSLEVEIGGKIKKIGITRVHLEEDAGKLLHYIGSRALEHSLVDLNRSGLPLLEIVSEPDMYSSEEAFSYLQELKSLIQYIGVSDCNMEEGSLRCDANISIRKDKTHVLGVKTELKNMNSFRAVKKALDYEVKRQKEVLSQRKKIVQETRLWDEKEGITHPMRRKEEAHDYRYFPEPDLLPLLTDKAEIEEIKKTLPELPAQRRKRFQGQYSLSAYDVSVITSEKELSDFYEDVVKEYAKKEKLKPEIHKKIANWIMGDFKARLKAQKISVLELPVSARHLSDLVKLIEDGKINLRQAKEVLKEMMEEKSKETPLPSVIIGQKGVGQISDQGAIKEIIREVIDENKKAAERLRQGEEKVLGYLIGQVMKKTQGKANPSLINKILKEELAS